METKENAYTLAVLIARFQVNELTDAHKELINTALGKHPKVLILLGLSPTKATINNPLDYQPRKQMLLEAFPPNQYPNLSIGYVKDNPSDEKWSENVDEIISDHMATGDTVVLYGGRDSFIPYYKGSFPTRELVSSRYISGTEIRRKISQAPQSNADFRAGAIWSVFQRYPAVFPTVDIAVYDAEEEKVLLARKPNEQKLRFVGGFVSPTDESYEDAASRELEEETNLSIGPSRLKYIGSAKIDDWRYRNEKDKIITHLYVGNYSMGAPEAGDDIAEVAWVPIKELLGDKRTKILDDEGKELNHLSNLIVDGHIPLMEMFLNYLEQNKTKTKK